MPGISFSGIGSGIDTASIVQKLMAVEQQPLLLLQRQQAVLQSKQAVYQQFRTQLQAISGAASALNIPTAFTTVAATSSDTAIATISSDSGAVAGNYALSVTQLAQSQKISSSAKTDTTSPLNLAPGTFTVNGKQVTVDGTDSLRSIAQKINGLGSGVTASLIDGGSGSAYLTITSSKTGAASTVAMADLSGNTLSALGIASGTSTTIREPITGGATSVGFNDQSTTLKTLIPGLPDSMTLNVNGSDVTVDTTTDTLQSLANKLSAVANVTASVRSVTVDGKTQYKLDVKGTDGNAPTFTGDTLSTALGLVKTKVSNEMVQAKDAAYSLDGVHLTSASNTITTAIPGATLTLLKGTDATPGTATLTLASDTAGAIGKIKSMIDAYNNAVDFINDQSAFDKDTFRTGILFGDSVAQQVQDNLISMVIQTVPGISGKYTSLQSLGFSVDEQNHLKVDDSTLTSALQSDPTTVAKLFQATGSSTDANLSFVTSTSKTKTAGAGSYAVNITQAATLGSFTGEAAQASASTYSETLTFNGSLFGSTAYKLTRPSGSTAADTVRAINTDAKLKDLLTASLDSNGKLLITSKKYGGNGNFTVGSDHEAATDNSGIGYGANGTKVTGLDVAGTINGEAATGAGQYLTGNSGNAKTDGLQIMYSGSGTGAVGSIQFTKGVGAGLGDLMLSFTDPVSGLLTSTDNSIKTQLDDMASEITDFQARLTSKQAELEAKYNAMESAISKLQGQAAQLSAILAAK